MLPLKSFVMPHGDHPGTFGHVRKHDIHTGIDLYTVKDADVFAVECGEIVKIDYFTGAKAGSPWWYETCAIMVEGKSGVINYGEIQPHARVGHRPLLGRKIEAGYCLGRVIPVLPPDKLRQDIPGHSCSMLHLELYEHGCREFAVWNLGEPRPKGLLDPTQLLFSHAHG